jgi:hypothetical protein
MTGRRILLVAIAAGCFGAVSFAAAAVRPAPAARQAATRAAYNPFTLKRKAAVAAAPVRVRVQGAVVRPPYRPETRSPYQPPVRGPYTAAAR